LVTAFLNPIKEEEPDPLEMRPKQRLSSSLPQRETRKKRESGKEATGELMHLLRREDLHLEGRFGRRPASARAPTFRVFIRMGSPYCHLRCYREEEPILS
jgi:hypothetical protein